MFYVWKFPYDHEKTRSFAPPILIISHRILGYLYVLIYLYIMWSMVPRLWSYQIELPARTVVPLSLKYPVQPIYPVLSGQNREYLIRQFKDISDGNRSNSVSAMMRAIVQEVTDEEVELIADYLSMQ